MLIPEPGNSTEGQCMYLLHVPALLWTGVAVQFLTLMCALSDGVANASEGFPGDSEIKKQPANAEGVGSVLGLGRSPGEGNGKPL